MAAVINANGTKIDFKSSINYMDDSIRRELHYNLAPCTDQKFFAAYVVAHWSKYAEPWELSKANPVW